MPTLSNSIIIDGASRVPYLDEYAGLWAMREENFWLKFEVLRQMNFSVHLDRVAEQQQQRQAGERRTTGGGYGYSMTADGIAIIELRGSLMKQESSADASTSTVAIRRDVRAAMNDPTVRAVMFVHDSPGGTVAGAFELADDIYALSQKKPTASFVDGLSASADYLQAAMTHTISAFRSAEIGSIGTRMVIVDSSKRADQMGLKVHAIDTGGMKSAGQPGTEITPEQLSYFGGMVNDAQKHFDEAVSRGRKISADQAKQLADGRVHSAGNAQQLRLIDHVENFDQAMARLSQRIDPQKNRTTASISTKDALAMATYTTSAGRTITDPAEIREMFETAVEAQIEAGCSRRVAVDRVARAKPEVHRAYTAVCNPRIKSPSAADPAHHAAVKAYGDRVHFYRQQHGMTKEAADREIKTKEPKLRTDYIRAREAIDNAR